MAGLGVSGARRARRARRPLLTILGATSHAAREEGFVTAMRTVAARHNGLDITRPVDESIGFFHERPFRVLGAGRFADACLERVADPQLRALPLVGAIDQFVDSTDVLSEPPSFQAVNALYEAWLSRPREEAAM